MSLNDVKIQAFIFCWRDYVSEALKMENLISPLAKTTVINSNVNFHYGKWINIKDGYFAEQWNTLLEHIDDDTEYVFHIQADAFCDDYEALFRRFRKIEREYPIGVYAPDVSFTPCKYNLYDLKKYADNLYRVPNTDCTCWFINTELMDKKPLFDLSVNKTGWGADFYYIALALTRELLVMRDYSIEIHHPRNTGYDHGRAYDEYVKWLFQQDAEIFMQINHLMKNYELIRIRDQDPHTEGRNP